MVVFICARAKTAPMVNNATGEAASASKPTVAATGVGSEKSSAEASPPKPIAHGIGFTSTPLSARRKASAAPCSSAPSSLDSAMHSDEVMTKSTAMAAIAGPAAAWAGYNDQQNSDGLYRG